MALTYAEFMDSVRAGTISSAGVQVTPQFAGYLGQNPAYAQQLFQWWDSTGQAPTDLTTMAAPGAGPGAAPAAPTSALTSSGGMPGFGSGPAQPAVPPSMSYPAPGQEYIPTGSAPGSAPGWASGMRPQLSLNARGGNAVSSMLVGYGMALIGIVISVVSFLATANGGTYFVSWGLIIFGLYRGIRGTVRFLQQR